ncbi:FIG01964566: Predicted membrane protein, hemolysin III homolog [hydrothermal vent metagenome]|uniref:FIG01964566: Predicted membrane protein, hemolysin III homolog n=1 Tax=hydrothermal vent metagenome TaxID=652676 RepID=A0A3B1BLL7_9ZZZZ
MISIPGFSEPVSSLSHLLPAGLFFFLGIFLLIRERGNRIRILSLAVFVFASVFMLAMSGVFHLLEPGGNGRAVLQRLDHAAIFVLIAGTFTPIHIILFRGWRRWGVLCLLWLLASGGLTIKTIFFNEMNEWLGLLLYLGLGWLGAITAVLIYQRYRSRFLPLLLYGAVAYTLGALIDFFRLIDPLPGVIGPHELFHMFVLIALSLHWYLVFCISETHRHGKLYPHPGQTSFSIE